MKLTQQDLNVHFRSCDVKKGLNEIKSDEVLKIIATDPGSKKDFDAFCRQTGHELLSLQDEDGVITFFIKKRRLS